MPIALTVNSSRRPTLLLGAALGAASLSPLAAADVLTWHGGFESLSAGWSGGPPINGQASWSGYSDSDSNPPVGYQLLASARNTAGLSTGFYSTPGNNLPPGTNLGGLDDNNTYAYDGHWADGTPDNSLRTFAIGVTERYVFSLSEAAWFISIQQVNEALGPWSQCFVEPGTYSNGTFTPSGSGAIDILTLAVGQPVYMAPGDYRYQAQFASNFEADHGFYLGNGANWRVYLVPSPGALTALALSGVLTARRRRC